MSKLILPNKDFPFSKLTLANPQSIQGGAYFSKIRISGEPVIIQTPKSLTKNGIHKTEKKIYCDIMLNLNNNDDFIEWVNEFEISIKNLIFEKRNLWFHNNMDYDSIDYHWQPLLRSYKQDKRLLRCFISKKKHLYKKDNIQIYDEEENKLTLDNIESTSKIISILEISGLKFTQQSFQVEFIIKQIMILKDKPLFNKCLIKLNSRKEDDSCAEFNDDSDTESNISIEDATSNADNDWVDLVKSLGIPKKEKSGLEKTIEDNATILDGMNDEYNESASVANETTNESAAVANEVTNESAAVANETTNESASVANETTNESADVANETTNESASVANETTNESAAVANETTNESASVANETTNESGDDDITNRKNNLSENNISIPKSTEVNDVKNIDYLEESLEKNGIISEIELLPPSKTSDSVKLKNPNEVYLEIYKDARTKAKEAKKVAVQAYLDAKRIKSLYLLNEIESSDDDDIEAYLE